MKDRRIGFLVHLGITVASLAFCAFVTGILHCRSAHDVFKVLSDSFFITGGVFIGLGMISFAIREGVFDINGYRRERGAEIDSRPKRRWFRTLTFFGLACLVLAIVFMLPA